MLPVLGQQVDGIGCQGVAQCTVRGRGRVLLLYLLQHLGRDAAIPSLSHGTDGHQQS